MLNVVLLPTPSIPYPHQCKTSPILLSPEHLVFLRKTLAPIHHILGYLLFQDRDMYRCKVNSMHERLLTGLYSNTMFNNIHLIIKGRRGRDIFIVGFTNDSCSYIPTAPAYGVYISQLIRCSKACVSYHEFLASMLLPIGKLMNQ